MLCHTQHHCDVPSSEDVGLQQRGEAVNPTRRRRGLLYFLIDLRNLWCEKKKIGCCSSGLRT